MYRWIFIGIFAIFISFSWQSVIHAESRDGKGTVDELFQDGSSNDEQSPLISELDDGKREETGMTFPIIKMFLGLAIILVLIYGLAKFVNKKTKSFSENRAIATIGGVSVGNNRSVQVVKIGDRVLVVGVGETVELLKEISDQEEIEKLFTDHDRDNSYDNVFSNVKTWFQKRAPKNRSFFSSLLDQELNEMANKRKTMYNLDDKKESSNE